MKKKNAIASLFAESDASQNMNEDVWFIRTFFQSEYVLL